MGADVHIKKRKEQPSSFYRVHRNNAFTEYYPRGSLEGSKIAFKSQGPPFDCERDLTYDRVMRHLEWENHEPMASSFVSVFDSQGWCEFVQVVALWANFII
jgi:hypothetical protein